MKATKKILVTGASGMLGRALMRRLAQHEGWEVRGTCRSRVKPGLVQCDLCDAAATEAMLDEYEPKCIVHTAAIRDPDEFAQDEAAAVKLNVDATERLRDWAVAHGARMIYVSSDYVFDGTAAPYTEYSPTAPANAYGRSKLEGEHRMLGNPMLGALRVPVLWCADVETLRESSVTRVADDVLKMLERGGTLTLDDWAVRYPTDVREVADVLAQMVEKGVPGICQWSALEPMTKYDMGLTVLKLLNKESEAGRLVRSGEPANGSEPRPKDCHLLRAQLELDYVVKTAERKFEDIMRELLVRIGAIPR